jgi:hypothetical protein
MNRLGFVVSGVVLMFFGLLVLPGLLWPQEGWNVCDGLVTPDSVCSFSIYRFMATAGVFVLLGLYVVYLGLRKRSY